jgi:2-isopropylmalate synthase
MDSAHDTDRLIVFDTTLRDGEQSPGGSMDLEEKLEVARALTLLGVDVIEAGFPIASEGDFAAVRAVAREVQGPIVAALARCQGPDIDRAWEAVREAARPRLHVFLATSPIHRQWKLGMTRTEVVAAVAAGVARARALCDDVEFSAEDAVRTEPDFLAEVAERAIAAGATTLNVPDTVGYAVPSVYAHLIARLRGSVRGAERVVWSVHCHDDLGLAVANSLAGIEAGARQVECTVNGIGERAGNCALEEVVMAVRTHRARFGLTTRVRSERLYPTSRLVSAITGLTVQRNKAIVGQNAFAHEAGIHQHGMLKNPTTYEILRPEDVGFPSSQMVLGKHSGRHALRARLLELGFELDEPALDALFVTFKALADRKKEVFDSDLVALAGGGPHGGAPRPAEPGEWQLVTLQAHAGNAGIPSAVVVLRDPQGEERKDAACGDGPLEAAFHAILRLTGIAGSLRDLEVRSVTRGEDAQAEAVVEVEHGGKLHRGRGLSTDIVEAAVRAALAAVNRILAGADGEVRSEAAGVGAAAASGAATAMAQAGGAR